MRIRKKRSPYMYLAILTLIMLIGLIFYTDPTQIITLQTYKLPFFLAFFLIFPVFLFSLFSFTLLNNRRSILISLFILSLLILRYFGFRNIIHVLVLGIIFLLLELITKNSHKPSQRIHSTKHQ